VKKEGKEVQWERGWNTGDKCRKYMRPRMEERRKRGRECSRNEGWKRGESTAEARNGREEEEGEGVQQRREMGLFKDSNISNYSLCIMRL